MSKEHRDGRARGMRDLATVQTLLGQHAPASRTQAVSRFARLENERMRLLRELNAWTARKLNAERMLAKVEDDICAMQRLLIEPPDGARAAGRAMSSRRAPTARGASRPDGATAPVEPAVLIEY